MDKKEQQSRRWGICPKCGATEYVGEPFLDTTSLHAGRVVEGFTCAKCATFWLEMYECIPGHKYTL